MPYTFLQEALRTQPAEQQPLALADYRGSTTAARFSDAQPEFAALQNGCGVSDLGFRTWLSITGKDRTRWMNGMVTNNIRDLAVGCGVYAFLLNPQGHILGDMFVFNQRDSLLVETDRSQAEKVAATFDHYIIMDDVTVTSVEQQTALGVAGPKARAVLKAAGMQVPDLDPLQPARLQCDCGCGCVECTIVRTDEAQHEVYEIWLAAKDVYNTWSALLAAGATPVGCEALEVQRIVSGTPLYGVDIRERDLPQETEQTRALHFNKGCYIGQEIVERIRSRGSVHRKLAGFLSEGVEKITAGMKVASSDKEVGEITSVAAVNTPAGNRTVALGYVRREVGMPGREVLVGTAKASVVQLPISASGLLETEAPAVQRV